ncbi:MAG TPA: hypothetical protein VJ728_15780, partial [Candidatus Binataceae bacterium]|nr:hypothetical protein [Candidatus Binataceae bacterium]
WSLNKLEKITIHKCSDQRSSKDSEILVEKLRKSRGVYALPPLGFSPRELRLREIYVDPTTHALLGYRRREPRAGT